MARPSMPLQLVKGHINNDVREMREKTEQSLYTGETFHESDDVKSNKVAHREFIRLKRLFGKIKFVDALDEQLINQYCLEIDNLDALQKMLIQMRSFAGEIQDIDKKIEIYSQINRVIASIRQSKELILKYSDRLFLNPASRIKSVPKKIEKQEEPSGMAKFLQKRADGH